MAAAGVVNVCLTAFWVGRWPQTYHYFWLVKASTGVAFAQPGSASNSIPVQASMPRPGAPGLLL